MISIVVPVYNAEKYLNRCIESILKQTFSDFELLLIDDGSTDRSGVICDNYSNKDSRVKTIHKRNGGECSARNVGLDNVSGKWIAFVDADDYVEPNWLSIFMNNCDGCDVDVVVQGFFCDGTEYPFPTGIAYKGKSKDGLPLLINNGISGYVWVKLFRFDIIKKNNIRFNENIHFRGDEDFVIKYILFSNNMICTPEKGYHYVVPEWSSKYKHLDNFYTSCSIFNSIKQIYKDSSNVIYQRYLQELNNALFNSFKVKNKDREHRIIVYQQIVGKAALKSRLNFFTRWILYLIHFPKIVVWLFDIKEKISAK